MTAGPSAADSIAAPFRSADRLAAIRLSEILRIGAAAAHLRQQGRQVIILAAGEPDFDTPPHVKEAAMHAIAAGHTKYTALDGTLELKAAIARKFKRENGIDYALDEITVGAGAKQVIHNALLATLNAGDEVILASPYWTSYADMVLIAGGRPIPISCNADGGFVLRPCDLESAITPRTRWVFLNSPSNPSGAVYTRVQLQGVLEVLTRHPHVWLMSDDIYEHFLYDDRPFATAVQIDPSLKERALTVNGVSKAYAMTGWRVGYAGGPKALIAAMAIVQSQSTSNPCSISQAAATAALMGPQGLLAERREIFRTRRDFVVERLNSIDGIECACPAGAFYVFPSCAGIIGRRNRNGTLIDSDDAFCRYLLASFDVAVIPGTCFGYPGHFRVSYAASQHDLVEACRRISAGCESLL